MKISIENAGRSFHMSLPTNLLFSRFVLRMAARSLRINDEKIPGLTPEAADALAQEIKHLKKKHGTWTLVEVQSADGEQITITL